MAGARGVCKRTTGVNGAGDCSLKGRHVVFISVAGATDAKSVDAAVRSSVHSETDASEKVS